MKYLLKYNFHLKLLLVLIKSVNFCFSPITYRILHCINAIAFGMYYFGITVWLVMYFLIYIFILETMVSKYIFDVAKQYRIGQECITELKAEIIRRKEQNN